MEPGLACELALARVCCVIQSVNPWRATGSRMLLFFGWWVVGRVDKGARGWLATGCLHCYVLERQGCFLTYLVCRPPPPPFPPRCRSPPDVAEETEADPDA